MKKFFAFVILLTILLTSFCSCSKGSGIKDAALEPDDYTVAELSALLEDGKTTVDQSLILINSDHPVPEGVEFSVSEYINAAGEATDVYMNDAMLSAYAELSAAVLKKFGTKLYVADDYRTADEQAAIYEEQGAQTAAKPGYSEHQTGLALDVYIAYYAGAGFVNCKEGRWVNKNCCDYGFIIRYPEGKANVTGFDYEPWHIRYVGLPHSRIMTADALTLEEYLAFLAESDTLSYENYIIMTVPTDSVRVVIPADYQSLTVCDTGCGYYVMTFTIR